MQTENKNLTLKVEWLNDDGIQIDPVTIKQGTTFWGHYTVGYEETGYKRIDEVALLQVLPSGWEVENTRLSGESLPAWMKKLNLNHEEYLDIRDDRVMWFFDLTQNNYKRRGRNNNQQGYNFVVKLNAVTVGEYNMPPTLVEAMYNNDYQATKAGKKVIVSAR